jgi:hypothetical protein
LETAETSAARIGIDHAREVKLGSGVRILEGVALAARSGERERRRRSNEEAFAE